MKKFRDFQYKGTPYSFKSDIFCEEQEEIDIDNSTYPDDPSEEGGESIEGEEGSGGLQENFEKLVNDLTEVLSKKDMKIVFDKIGDFLKSLKIEGISDDEEEEEEPSPNEEDKKNESVAGSDLSPENDNDLKDTNRPLNF
jgi:hypothetical protein